MRRQASLAFAAITAALLAPVTALAEVDTSDWKCEYCPFDERYRAEYAAGLSTVQGDGYRYGNGTGYDDDGLYAELGWQGRYVGERFNADWNFDDLGLDSRSVAIGLGKPGTFDVELSYRAYPYRLFDTTSSPYSRSAGTLTLPSGWVPAPVTMDMSALDTSRRPVDIEHDREVLGFGTAFRPTDNVRLYADYRQTRRDGMRIGSGPNFTNAALLPQAIDDETGQIDAGVRYTNQGLTLSLGWHGSFYRNDVDSLTWDNAFVPASGADSMRLATEPDNDFTQLSFAGAYRSDLASTVVAVSAAAGRGEQSDNLLPYTINASLSPPSLPVTALDGKIDTANYAVTVTSKPFRGARVKLSYRFDERDNRTSVATWDRVITDSFVTSAAENNRPYSFERSRLNLSGSYKLFDTVTIAAGYDRTEFDRELQEVASQTEDSGWGRLRWRPTPWLEATFKGGDSRREIDDYDTDVAMRFGQNPLMRKFYLAYRYREFAEASLQASLPKQPLSVGMTYLYADDSYTKSELGLTGGREDRFTFDVNWAMSDSATIYLAAGDEGMDSTQIGSETLSGPVWTASHEDEFSFVSAGLRVTGVAERADVSFDYTHGRGETEILYAGGAVSATPLPELESDLDSLRFKFSYRVSDRLLTDVVVRYETFDTADWALDGVLPATIPSVLTLGAESYDYSVWAFGVGFRYLTGDDDD